ncbi:hypothetical protein ACLMAJ_19450 [Nocardia sp. KC 131]|uniref:hypothetical protein n=1 Tax=Nocardia arseniciresistens TaxID=3392119 RepID=UPI00398EF1E1
MAEPALGRLRGRHSALIEALTARFDHHHAFLAHPPPVTFFDGRRASDVHHAGEYPAGVSGSYAKRYACAPSAGLPLATQSCHHKPPEVAAL